MCHQHENEIKPFQKGDKVIHSEYGTGEIFELSYELGFVDINLDIPFINSKGRKKDTVIVPFHEIEKK